ncbi:2Fe-2S iron-sulfur cluster binding domain-containing protein [Candidatus Peregrinibacteria bacterium]|nr:2Fe-2S iron-sulfur cluster binding domain-containing protein [Candidatus Peregrinibacteria bacterium]
MPKIKYDSSGEEVEVENGTELRDVCQKQSWDVPFGCEDGVCGTCIVKINSGEENLTPMEEKEKTTLEAMGLNDGKHRLACQCKVSGGDISFETN